MTSVSEQPSKEHLDDQPQTKAALLNARRCTALAEIDRAPFSLFYVKICLVAGVGFFTDAYDMFTIIISTTMLGFVYGTDVDSSGLKQLTKWQAVGLKLATPVGSLIGQLVLGWLADVLGRKRIYGIELTIMIVSTFAQALSGQGPCVNIIYTLIIWRFIMGVGVGGDYPLSAVITSEFSPTKIRGRLMAAVFSFQGWGQLGASLVALIAVAAFNGSIHHSTDNVDYTWRLLIGIGCIPAVIALYFRLTIPETPRFTMDIDRNISRAAHDITNCLNSGRYSIYIVDDSVQEPRVAAPRASINDFCAHFSKWKNFRVLIGTAYSWFALDVAFYILALDNAAFLTIIRPGVVSGDAYTSLMNICAANIILTLAGYIPGLCVAFSLIDVWGRKQMQLVGFAILTILFWIMGFGFSRLSGNPGLMILYCLANFFQNFGPNTTTFIVPGEVFPTRYRATAYGISAAAGKLGAVFAQLLFAYAGGRLNVIFEVLSFIMLTGVLSTLLIPETKQRTLESLSNEDQNTFITGQETDIEMTVGSASSTQV